MKQDHQFRRMMVCLVLGSLLLNCLPAAAMIPVDQGPEAIWADDSSYQAAAIGEPPEQPIEIFSADPAAQSNTQVKGALAQYDGEVLCVQESGFARWNFTLPKAVRCALEITACQMQGDNADVTFSVMLNGKLPFPEASGFSLRRIYRDDIDGTFFETDDQGNDICPCVIENPQWQKITLQDEMGYQTTPYQFSFPAGKNTLQLTCLRAGMAIRSIRLVPVEQPLSYAAYLAAWKKKGAKEMDSARITVQAERTLQKNDKSILPLSDHSSPGTVPQKAGKTTLNYIGGSSWKKQGDSVTWELMVPQTGLYRIALKCRQKFNRDLRSGRRLLLDGAVPFAQAEQISLAYSSDWQNVLLGGEKPQLFYLTKGRHTLTLQAILGEVGPVAGQVEAALKALNADYQDILMLTGATPDAYRDYGFAQQIPDTLRDLTRQAKVLEQASATLQKLTGSRGANTAILDRFALQLRQMAQKPQSIAGRFGAYKDNLGALGNWILDVSEQPLDLDEIYVLGVATKLPSAKSTFREKLAFEFAAFFNTFITDYSLSQNRQDDAKKIDVWLATGRDQAQVLKKLIESDFIPKEKIWVDLKLVQSTVLLSSTVAGKNPDVYLQASNADAVNYAMRGAVTDLTKFPDYARVESRFHTSAVVPMRYRNGVYGLPETQLFTMLFYRKDILTDLGLGVPETWDEINEILPTLQKNNMSFAMPVSTVVQPELGMPTFYLFLLQGGGSVYNKQKTATALDSDAAVAAFTKWTGYYTDYKLAQTYDAANRFRRGETPLLVADYTLYNTLQVFAPEIRSQWSFTTVPGAKRADGTIDRTNSSNGTCCMMMSQNSDPDSSWAFLNWWTSAEIQSAYGTEIENVMGASARYPTANLEAMGNLPWSAADANALLVQQKELVGIEQIPGSYFLSRHLNNAFRKVVLSGGIPRDTLLDAAQTMNREIAKKIQEFAH